MKYLLLIALLPFQVSANKIFDYYRGLGICEVMLHQLDSDTLALEMVNYWNKTSKEAGLTLEDYKASCTVSLHAHYSEAVKEEKTMKSGSL